MLFKKKSCDLVAILILFIHLITMFHYHYLLIYIQRDMSTNSCLSAEHNIISEHCYISCYRSARQGYQQTTPDERSFLHPSGIEPFASRCPVNYVIQQATVDVLASRVQSRLGTVGPGRWRAMLHRQNSSIGADKSKHVGWSRQTPRSIAKFLPAFTHVRFILGRFNNTIMVEVACNDERS